MRPQLDAHCALRDSSPGTGSGGGDRSGEPCTYFTSVNPFWMHGEPPGNGVRARPTAVHRRCPRRGEAGTNIPPIDTFQPRTYAASMTRPVTLRLVHPAIVCRPLPPRDCRQARGPAERNTQTVTRFHEWRGPPKSLLLARTFTCIQRSGTMLGQTSKWYEPPESFPSIRHAPFVPTWACGAWVAIRIVALVGRGRLRFGARRCGARREMSRGRNLGLEDESAGLDQRCRRHIPAPAISSLQ
jgi:hypothetical protein